MRKFKLVTTDNKTLYEEYHHDNLYQLLQIYINNYVKFDSVNVLLRGAFNKYLFQKQYAG